MPKVKPSQHVVEVGFETQQPAQKPALSVQLTSSSPDGDTRLPTCTRLVSSR